MKKPSHDRIYLLPEDGIWCWADRPAPGIGQSNDDAVEYVRADLFEQVTAQRDSATSQLETARTAINNNFNQLREHADKMQDERDNAWQELREIREAIGANPEESTADEVRRVNAHNAELVNILTTERDFLLTKLDENEAQKVQIAELVAQVDAFKDWRRLALQFDGQRMQAMSLLKQVVTTNFSYDEVSAFVAAAPVSGNEHLRDIQADAVLAVIEFFPACRDIDINALQSYAERVRAGEV